MATDDQKAKEQFDIYTCARDAGHRDFIIKAQKCENFFYGNQWDPDVLAKLTSQRKPTLTINMVFANMITAQGEQIATGADIAFTPSSTGNPESAAALTKIFMQIANNNDMRWIEQEVFSAGAVTSRGFFDVRIGFDDNMRGEVKIKKAQAKNIIVDSDADSYEPDEWKQVFYSKWMTSNDIRANYANADAAAKDLEERDGSKFELGYDSIDHVVNSFGRTYNLGSTSPENYRRDKNIKRYIRVLQRQYKERVLKKHFVDRINGDMRVIPDTWDNNRISEVIQAYDLAVIDRKVDVIRWCDTADNIVLLDKEMSAYKHFTFVPYFPVFYEGKTMGLVENLISPQELLNKAESQELHIINTTANSGWKLKKGSLQNMDAEDLEIRGAESGLVLELENTADAEKIQPNNVPTGVDRMAFKAENFLKQIVGISDSGRGFDRADVAAKAIRAKQQAGAINLAVPFNNLVRTRHIVARNVLDLVQTYYTEERTFSLTSNALNPRTETITVNQVTPEGEVVNDLTMGEYNVVVTDVPARDSFEDQQFDEAMRMREQGINIPDQYIIKNSHLVDKGEIVEALTQGEGETEEQQMLAQLELQKVQLENAGLEAKTLKDKADAALILARAQKETLTDPNGKGGDDGATQQLRHAEEMAFKRQAHLDEIELKQEELDARIALETEKMEREYALKEKEAQRKAVLDRIAARAKEQQGNRLKAGSKPDNS